LTLDKARNRATPPLESAGRCRGAHRVVSKAIAPNPAGQRPPLWGFSSLNCYLFRSFSRFTSRYIPCNPDCVSWNIKNLLLAVYPLLLDNERATSPRFHVFFHQTCEVYPPLCSAPEARSPPFVPTSCVELHGFAFPGFSFLALINYVCGRTFSFLYV